MPDLPPDPDRLVVAVGVEDDFLVARGDRPHVLAQPAQIAERALGCGVARLRRLVGELVVVAAKAHVVDAEAREPLADHAREVVPEGVHPAGRVEEGEYGGGRLGGGFHSGGSFHDGGSHHGDGAHFNTRGQRPRRGAPAMKWLPPIANRAYGMRRTSPPMPQKLHLRLGLCWLTLGALEWMSPAVARAAVPPT